MVNSYRPPICFQGCFTFSHHVQRLFCHVLTIANISNATLVRLPARQLCRLQSVLHAAARVVFSARKFDHMTPLLQELHWLRVPERRAGLRHVRCFGRTGPQNLGGPQFRTFQKLTCQFERLWMMFIWRKLPADTRFDLSLDFFLSFCRGNCNADQRTKNAATRCVLRAYNTAKCDCGRGSAPDPAGKAYSVSQNPWERYRVSPLGQGPPRGPGPTPNFG